MEFKGIIANFLGDSITEGHGVEDWRTQTFHQLLKEKLGFKEARNYGVGGTRIAKQHTPSFHARHDLDFVLRAKDMEDDADLVVVFGGSNDFGHGDALFGDKNDKTNDTFCGALEVLYTLLREKYPTAKIVVLTPLHRWGDGSTSGQAREQDSKKPEGSHPLKDYVEAIKDAAQRHGFYIIDLFNDERLSYEGHKEYFPDGLHPNPLGHTVIAKVVEEGLLKMK